MTNMELTAIFGTHRDERDAQAAVNKIEPRSIVFYEGILAYAFYSRKTLYKILSLAANRLLQGHYSPDPPGSIAAKSIGKSTPYGMTLWDELIAKDCAVITADYAELGLTSTIDARYEAPQVIVDFIENPRFHKVDEVTEADLQFVVARSKEVEMRELAAVERVRSVRDALSLYSCANLATTGNGDAKAYIVYGSAHRSSLPRRLREGGIPVNTTVLLDEANERFMEDSDVVDEEIRSGCYEHNARAYFASMALDHLKTKYSKQSS